MNIPIVPTMNLNKWYPKQYDLGLILAGQTKNFDLSLVNSCFINELLLLASTTGMFNLTIYSRQARAVQDISHPFIDSSDTSIITIKELRYDDFDLQNKLYITVGNGSAADINFKLVVKYV